MVSHSSQTIATPRSVFMEGVQAILPVLLGIIPFGTIVGVTAVAQGIPTMPALGMSLFMFAGAAQLVAVQLINNDAPLLVIWASTFFINLRFMMYSTSLAPHFREAPGWIKGWLSYLVADQVYAVSIIRYTERPNARHKPYFFLGGGMTLFVAWNVSTAVGVFLGAQVPASWSLDFAIPLTFLALVFPALKDWPAALAAISAGVTAVLAANLPYNLGLIIAALTGIFIGYLAETRQL